MFGLDDILGAVTGVAGLVGAAGKGKGSGPTQISGFQSLPKNIQDLLQGPILNQITTQLNKPYTTVPTRRAEVSDYDPVFGSQSVQDLQKYYDDKSNKNAASMPTASVVPAGAAGMPAPNNSASVPGRTQQYTPSAPGSYSNKYGYYDAATGNTTPNSLYANGPGGINTPPTSDSLSQGMGLSGSDMAKLKQILSGMGGQA